MFRPVQAIFRGISWKVEKPLHYHLSEGFCNSQEVQIISPRISWIALNV